MTKACDYYQQAAAAAAAADGKRKQDQEARKQRRDAAAAAGAATGADGEQQQQQNGGEASSSSTAAAGAGAAEGAEGANVTFEAQVKIMEGNALYDWSQLLAAAGAGDWRAMLDGAVGLFKGAACTEADLRSALKNHTHADQLDLGPDPEPVDEEVEEGKGGKEEEGGKEGKAAAKQVPEAKGLPSLEVRKKA